MTKPTLSPPLPGAPHTPHANPSSSMPNSRVDRVFGVMAAHYGARFAGAWRGTDAATVKAVWAKELGALRPEQIRQGIARLCECKFPPTLPEFIALCKADIPEAHRLRLPLPPRTAEEREEGRKRFAEMKRQLGWTGESQ
jgi:hypothetical protein